MWSNTRGIKKIPSSKLHEVLKKAKNAESVKQRREFLPDETLVDIYDLNDNELCEVIKRLELNPEFKGFLTFKHDTILDLPQLTELLENPERFDSQTMDLAVKRYLNEAEVFGVHQQKLPQYKLILQELTHAVCNRPEFNLQHLMHITEKLFRRGFGDIRENLGNLYEHIPLSKLVQFYKEAESENERAETLILLSHYYKRFTRNRFSRSGDPYFKFLFPEKIPNELTRSHEYISQKRKFDEVKGSLLKILEQAVRNGELEKLEPDKPNPNDYEPEYRLLIKRLPIRY